MRALPLVLALGLFCAARAAVPGGWRVPERGATTWQDSTTPPASPAAVALAAARGLRRGTHQVPGQVLLRGAVVEAHLAVAHAWPDEPEGAEAAFRAAELLRAAGDAEGALEAFEQAARLGRGTPLGARARYEAGHVHRREGRHAEALEAYASVAADPGAEAYRRDLAGLWTAKTRLELGDRDGAELCLRRLVGEVADPLTLVRVHDELILILVERGELEGACGWLAACKQAVASPSKELTRRGARVRSALEDLRCLPRLRSAIGARLFTR
ncbi:MAG: tetratricopeptide repeat protein [Planctomycetota bacterium]|nr:tetratricopeptide repeat protein [Planctomycetota bacterium]